MCIRDSGGTVESLTRFVGQFPGIVNAGVVNEVAAFANAFDTGLAPATTFQSTMVPGLHTQANFDATLLAIKNQALAGNCDIVVAGSTTSGGQVVPFTIA